MSESVATRFTNRWAGVDAVAWASAAVGLLTREPGILLLAGVGVVFTAYARLGTPPQPDIQVTREVDVGTPVPGQEVTVRLTVENRSDRDLFDVRIADGVPTALRVLDGSPHLGTVLRAGETLLHTYTVHAERGTHSFDPVAIVCRSLNGAHETELTDDVETGLTCYPEMNWTGELPLRSLVSHHGGRIPTDSGGSGIEFYGIREYRSGDPTNRINWARRARTGNLTTLEFREERMATVILLVDARNVAYVRGGDDETERHAVESSIQAAAETFAGLLDAGNRVGVAAIGSEFVWHGAGAGDVHRRRARNLLATHPTLSSSPERDRIRGRKLSTPSPKVGGQIMSQLHQLDVHLPEDAQVLFFSPLADDTAVTISRRLQISGHAVTVVSPNVTDTEEMGARLARLHRHRRVQKLHRSDVRLIDWHRDDSLPVAFERVRERWQ